MRRSARSDADVEQEIRGLVDVFGYMPSYTEVREYSCGLYFAARKMGGYTLVAERLGFPVRTKAGRELPPGEAGFRRALGLYRRPGRAPWKLTRKQAKRLFASECHYCGAPPSNVALTVRRDPVPFVYQGIDRVDNRGSYEDGNVVPCCFECNRAKGDRSAEDFITHVHRIAVRHPAD